MDKRQIGMGVELVEQFNEQEMVLLVGGSKLKEIWDAIKDFLSIHGVCSHKNGENCGCNGQC